MRIEKKEIVTYEDVEVPEEGDLFCCFTLEFGRLSGGPEAWVVGYPGGRVGSVCTTSLRWNNGYWHIGSPEGLP